VGRTPPRKKILPTKIPYFHIDAFVSNRFSGNPAGVCILEKWLPNETLQKVAFENKLSETAFLIKRKDHFDLRWFTPSVEVDLCGHATLATAFVVYNYLAYADPAVRFQSKSGLLSVEKAGELLILDFPSRPPVFCEPPEALLQGLGHQPVVVGKSIRDYLAVFSKAEDILSLKPDWQSLEQLDCLGIMVTAPGEEVDFVSRFFAPRAGVLEDPVTGSAHCTLIPYWATRLGKQKLVAWQLSKRGGELFCEDLGDRVKIGGKAVLYMEGFIHV